MKKIKFLSLVAVSLLLLTNCKKENKSTAGPENKVTPTPSAIKVAEVNTPVYGKLTATWCGPCGAWGWTMNEEIITATNTKAISMGLYGSTTSNFTNPAVNQWFSDFGGKSYPNFVVNGENKTAFGPGGGSIYTDQTKTDVLAAIDAFIATPVQASAGGNLTWTGQKLTVKSAVKCFKDQSGEFYVGAYMIEDKAKSIQASQTGTVEHHHVCQGSMTASNIYGVKFDGALTAGSQTDLPVYEFDVPSTWVKTNMYVALIIWKKVGTKFTFVNAARVN